MKNKVKILILLLSVLCWPNNTNAQQTVSVSLHCKNQQVGFEEKRLAIMADTEAGGTALHWNAGGPQGVVRELSEWSFFGDAVVFFHKTDDPDNGVEYRGVYLIFGKAPGSDTRHLWYSDFTGGNGDLGNFTCRERGNTSSSTTSSFNTNKK